MAKRSKQPARPAAAPLAGAQGVMPATQVYGYLHCACMGPAWQRILQELLDALDGSGLLAATAQLHVGVIGADADFNTVKTLLKQYTNVAFTHHGNDFSQYEYPTLQLLETRCRRVHHTGQDPYVYYLQTKGVSKAAADGSENPVWRYWREAMIEGVIHRYTECVAGLAGGADVAGVYWHERKQDYPPHFSGNFWWAKASHICRLPHLDKPVTANPDHARYWAENWLGSAKPKVCDIAAAHTEWPYEAILQPEAELHPWTGKPALAAFERCFLINLAARPDRLAHATAQLARIGSAVVPLAEGFSGNVELQEGIPSRAMQLSVPKYPNHAGMAGCALAHWAILARAVHEGWESLCIMEDDLVLGKAFNERLAWLLGQLPADWEALWLGHVPRHARHQSYQLGPLNGYSEVYAVPVSVWGTHCYVLRGAGIRKMFEYMSSHQLEHADLTLEAMGQQDALAGKVYCAWPSLASQEQAALDSDIHTWSGQPGQHPIGVVSWSTPVRGHSPRPKPGTAARPGAIVDMKHFKLTRL